MRPDFGYSLLMRPDKVIIYRLGSLGDTTIALPFFNRIRQLYPKSECILVTNESDSARAFLVGSLIDGTGLIDRTIYYPAGTRDLRDIMHLLVRLRQTGAIDLVYLAVPRGSLIIIWRDLAFFRMCGIRNIHCAPFRRNLHDSNLDQTSGSEEMEIERLARCFRVLAPIDLDSPELWELHLRADEIQAADAVLAGAGRNRFISIGLGGKVPKKDWGTENWKRLVSSLAERFPNLGMAVVGLAEEKTRADDVLSVCTGPKINACGRLSARQSAALLRQSTAFVGQDSGPMHLAASQSVPVIAIFGPYNRPRRWHPFGRNHVVFHDIDDIQNIRVEAVLEALIVVLEDKMQSPQRC
jgi:ADP-heptose:LPS heptosyltransferase